MSSAPDITKDPDALADEPPPTRWPTAIGVISFIYALGGMLCALGLSVGTFFFEGMMRMGGMQVSAPGILKAMAVAEGVLKIALGITLLTGAIATLRRKRSGPGTLKVWALLRVVLILLAVISAVLTAPAQIAFQRSITQAQRERMREVGRAGEVPELTDNQIWRNAVIGIAVASAMSAAYPLFLGFYLSRQKITAQVEHWS